MSSKVIQKIGILFLVVYFLIGATSPFFGDFDAVTPFYSWLLFEQVPQEHRGVDNIILIHQVKDKTFSPPVFLEQAPRFYNVEMRMKQYRAIVRRLASSLQDGDDEMVEYYRNILERQFIDGPVVYEIAKVEYNLFERFEKGIWQDKETISIFRTE